MSIKIIRLGDRDELEPDDSGIYGTIKAGDIVKVQEFITSGANVNQVDGSIWTPLEIAANEGNLDIVKILLDAGASVQKGSSTPLELAASNGYTDVVNALLEAGNYAEKEKTKKFYDALMMATCYGHIDIVKALIAAGADVNRVVWDYGTALHYAIHHGHQAIAQLLLEIGARVDIRERDGNQWTPLMKAACQSSAEIAQMLIAAGADVNARDNKGQTPLIIAAEFGNAEVAGILLLSGADINARDNQGTSALMYASRNEPAEITEPIPDLAALQQMSAEVGDRLEDKLKHLETLGKTIDNIEKARRIGIARMLRIAGASEQGLSQTDLVKAAEQGNLSKVQALIQAGVNVNAKNSYGQTAILQAAGNNHLDVVAALIAAGADVNLGESNGFTPLISAANAGHIKIVRMLLQAGTDVNFHTESGYTALSNAQQGGHLEIVELLRKSGAKQYHEILIAQRRGINSLDLNDSWILVQAPIEQVSQALCQLRQATIWERDVFEREVELTDVCFIVFRFPGHNWTLIHEKNITVSYNIKTFNTETFSQQQQNRLKEKDTKALSEQLRTKAIYYACSDTASAVGYHLFETGESVEQFDYCCDFDFSKNESPAADECLIIGETFRFRSKLRHITIDDMPKRKWYDDEDEDFDDERKESIDDFNFVDAFFKSHDAYVPAWGGRGHNGAGRQVTLRVIGFDPEDIERMDFVAVK